VRYVENTFTIATKSTIGADFLSKEIEVQGKPVTLQVCARAFENASRFADPFDRRVV
jgi:hypothetical protein